MSGTDDDGGPSSDYAFCAFGTDCADCAPALTSERPARRFTLLSTMKKQASSCPAGRAWGLLTFFSF